MKSKLLFAAFLLCSIHTFAQQLSINETIAYLDKKLNETAELQRTFNDKFTYRPTKMGIGYQAGNRDKLILYYTRTFSDNTTDDLQYIFDPTHISTINISQDSYKDAVGMIAISFVSKTVIYKQKANGNVTDVNKDSFLIPYLNVDPLNFERIKRAFFHLKELYAGKKAPDPFAN
jgi:hypothetical protein